MTQSLPNSYSAQTRRTEFRIASSERVIPLYTNSLYIIFNDLICIPKASHNCTFSIKPSNHFTSFKEKSTANSKTENKETLHKSTNRWIYKLISKITFYFALNVYRFSNIPSTFGVFPVGKNPLVYLDIKAVFPTFVSPRTTILITFLCILIVNI